MQTHFPLRLFSPPSLSASLRSSCVALLACAALLAGCGQTQPSGQSAVRPLAQDGTQSASPGVAPSGAPLTVRIIAFNDLHGNLEPPHLAVSASDPHGEHVAVPAGGIAYMADAIRRLKQEN